MRTKLNYLLMLLAVTMLMPQAVNAEDYDKTYYFNNQGNDTELVWSSTTEEGCTYFTKIGSTESPERFAMEKDPGNRIDLSTKPGLYNGRPQPSKFLVSKLYNGDVVTFTISSSQTYGTDAALISSNASKNGNTFTMKAKGSLVVTIPRGAYLETIRIVHVDQPSYSYDPAIEIYDLSGISGSLSASTQADYSFYGQTAYIVDSPSGYPLNNRISVMLPGDFSWANGLKDINGTRLVGINNLKADDRVVITFSGGNATFTSRHDRFDRVFYAAGNVFKDDNNDGELNDGETVIEGPGVAVESGAVYTMTADGHLDFAIAANVIITKIEIYGDHQATMEDRYNGSAATGYTAYFSQTGQLIAKEHIVPGGLEVHIGNEDNNQHAIVVSSDRGPVSFVYDQEHYKMARQEGNSTNITNAPPATGTFYKFMPEVNGYLTVNFKAYNIKYNNYWNGNGLSQGNEVVATNGTCPYYIMVKDVNNNFGRYVHPNGTTQYAHDLSTGDNDKFENIRVTAGNTYYVYGWWSKDPQGLTPGTEGWNLGQSNCGVAQLIDVTFIPDNMVTPLAKWVASGTTADDNLADVTGFTTNDIHIKKMSASITGCDASIEGGKLKITNITFAEGANPGGTILIKLGDPNNDANPVFAYTIAYDASWQSSNWEDGNRTEGHTWDFSTNPLKGLDWTNTSGQASVVDFGTEAGPGLLYDEMHETNPDGSAHSDWTKTWRVINSSGQGTHDPMFLNKYDMEGDNADMMWDTEGLIFNTASNQSCINNEFVGVVDHSKTGTRNDPDRYVGILPGGSFTIPGLKAGDRVEIFMGSGDGSGANACKFNITGALDAIGQAISPSDIYNAGGSHWVFNAGNESRYRGAYQFISTGGEMTFTMNGGSMTKLYSITIYNGAKTATVDCTRNQSQTYNGEVYDGYAYSFNNDWRTTNPAKTAITLHYRGKGERLSMPTVIHQSGNISSGSENLFYGVIGNNSAPFIFYKSKVGDYGMFRMRVEDLELGNKYVADYALQNITASYLEKKNYPYTWDFTDLLGYVETDARILGERTNVDGYDPRTIDENEAYEIEFMNNSVGEDVKAVEQWKEYDADGDIPAGYGLQINNEPYGGGCMWAGGQLYAGNQPLGEFGETLGLSILPPLNSNGDTDVSNVYNGGVRISEEGLCLTGGIWRIKIPEVGTDAAVYVRATPIGTSAITAGVGNAATAFTYTGTATDGTGDKIYAVKGTGADMTLFFNNLIIKKIAVSTDWKKVNVKGWTTESRGRVIDPALTGYMTGKDMRTYIVTDVEYSKTKKQATLTRIDTDPSDNPKFKDGCLMPVATDGDENACIILNCTSDGENGIAGEEAKLLDGGFHLFVPDMHDFNIIENKEAVKKYWNSYGLESLMKSQVSPTNDKTIPAEEGGYTNYAFTCKYYDIDPETGEKVNSDQALQTGIQAFYRIVGGASSTGNQGYLPIKIEEETNNEGGETNPSRAASPARVSSPERFTIVFNNLSDVSLKEGDVNGDGLFNKLDVNTMADRLAGRPTAKFFTGVADMNNDGKVNIVDMTLMIKSITSE